MFCEWRATLACGAVRLLLVTWWSVTRFQADCLQPLCCVFLSVLFLLSDASYDQWDGRVAAAERLKQTLYGCVHHAFPTVSGGSELRWQHPTAEATILQLGFGAWSRYPKFRRRNKKTGVVTSSIQTNEESNEEFLATGVQFYWDSRFCWRKILLRTSKRSFWDSF